MPDRRLRVARANPLGLPSTETVKAAVRKLKALGAAGESVPAAEALGYAQDLLIVLGEVDRLHRCAVVQAEQGGRAVYAMFFGGEEMVVAVPHLAPDREVEEGVSLIRAFTEAWNAGVAADLERAEREIRRLKKKLEEPRA